jgi:hypothetical protein
MQLASTRMCRQLQERHNIICINMVGYVAAMSCDKAACVTVGVMRVRVHSACDFFLVCVLAQLLLCQ